VSRVATTSLTRKPITISIAKVSHCIVRAAKRARAVTLFNLIGSMMTLKKESFMPDLGLLPDVFRNYDGIEAVYLFGSAVDNRMNSGSDIDLAIVPKNPEIRSQRVEILSDLARKGFCNVDLVFLDGQDIVLKYEAVRNNKLIYQTDDFDSGFTYSKIIREYLDFLPYLQVQRMAYKERILDTE
jgi:uncharacterized protein